LLLRSLEFYGKSHLRVVLGTMVGTSVLVGALVIGDSVRYSLQRIVFHRLGETELALTSGDRFFRVRIADDLSRSLDTLAAPLLQTGGIAIVGGGERRLNDIRVIGVDGRFGEMGGINGLYNNISPDEAVINDHLAARLGLKEGDEFLVRIKKLDMIPREVPLSLDSDTALARRYRIKAVVSDARFGRFNLKADQVAPNNVFVSLSSLSKEMGYPGKANVLLIKTFFPQIDEAFKKAWTLEDVGLEVKELPGVELKSNRIFISPSIEEAALKIDGNVRSVLTYFVNEIAWGDRSTPYSFVSAPGVPVVPAGMSDDEIIVNEWLAGDLGAKVGDRVRLTYYTLGPMRELIEKSTDFRVRAIVPLSGPYADGDLMPDFPGLSGEQNCRDWDPGIPVDLDKIRDRDEDYWDRYRGTPKAFVTLNAAREMWRNRFGDLTALRFTGADRKEIEAKLLERLDPAEFGFVFREVKKEGLRAGSEGVDFGQLFLGLSFFIILAALLLTGLLYVFNVEKRSEENGLYLALGFPRAVVRRLVLMEGAVVIITGSILGCGAGVLYNRVILQALKTVWRGAVGTSALQIHLRLSTLLTGTVIGMVIAFSAIWLVTRRQFKQSVTGLQRGLAVIKPFGNKRPRVSILTGVSGIAGVIVLLVTTPFETGRDAFMFFFLAGSLLLISGISFTKALLLNNQKFLGVQNPFFKKGSGRRRQSRLSLFNIGVRNNSRRPVRSLTLTGLLACGVFIIFTVGANRIAVSKGAEKRESGTGGFALLGESAMPVLYDLNSEKGARFYGLESVNAKKVSYVQFRVKEGDDASCLNLNRVASPRLIAVDPGELTRRGAFTFVEKTGEVDSERPWSVLERELPGGAIPGAADQTVILWGLGKAVGDTLTYRDESGRTFKIKLVGGLANSIFQGSIIISGKAFMEKYPSISGYRFFLVDAPFEHLDSISKDLSLALRDQGLDLVPASNRLAEYNRVENTYLSIFLILGSFGLLLGSIGLGIVVWRNVTERRGELGLLRAVGFSRASIQKIVLSEHLILLTAGILCGTAAALLATLPSIMTPGSGVPYFTVILLLILVVLNGAGWTYFAVRAAVRGNLLASLRNE